MKFRLRRYFFLTSLPMVVIFTALSAYAYIVFSTNILVEQETQVNRQNTYLLSQLLWPQFQPHMKWSKGQSTASLLAAPAVSEIDKIVSDMFHGTNVMKAKLYNLDGITVYSSQPSQIGADKSSNPGFISASKGEVRSNLTWRNEFHAFEKIVVERDVVSSYLPLHDIRTREVVAVVELYSDVTDLVTRIHNTRNQVIFAALGGFGLLLAALYVIVARAEQLIHRQQKELADANNEISRLAYTDAITQIPNRNRFDQAIEAQIIHCRRDNEGFALLYIDLDDFKAINDSYGHGVGDALLAEMAQRLSRVARNTDTLYRIGGDEFALLLPGANTADAAVRVAEKSLDEMKDLIEIGGHKLMVGISIGVACYPGAATDASTLIELADNAMYRAKASGKNSYEIAD